MDTLSNTVDPVARPSLAGGAPQLTDITDRVRSLPDFDDHEQVLVATDRAAGLHAIIAIHDCTLGAALGGCRMWPYGGEEEAVTDVLRLSRGMTFKAAMAGVPAGGGKSVIIGDPATDKTEALFRAFGRAVDSLGGRYTSGEDVGVSVEDMNWAASETPHILGSGDRGGDPSPITAYGVYVGLMAAVRHRLHRNDLAGLKVAVQGLGHVGLELCALLHRAGARLTVTDVNAGAVASAVERFGAAAVEPDAIYDTDSDVFAPCALGGIINDDTVGRLGCAVVAGAANNQLLEARHGEVLMKNNVLYAPDYVINAGGLIAFSLLLAPEGFDAGRARRLTAVVGDTLAEIFQRATSERAATSEVADRIALERVKAGRSAA